MNSFDERPEAGFATPVSFSRWRSVCIMPHRDFFQCLAPVLLKVFSGFLIVPITRSTSQPATLLVILQPPPSVDRQDDNQLPHQPQYLSVVLLAELSMKNSESFVPSTREIVLSVHPAPPNLDRIVGISTENGQEVGT